MKVYGSVAGRLRFVVSCVLGLAVVLACAAAFGAATTSSAVAAGTGREKLPGHQGLVPPGAILVGPAPTSTGLPLTVTLKPRDPAALATEAQQVSDPKSPDYRHFLTPTEFAQEFGPTSSTIAEVTSSLRKEGLSVGTPSATGLSLPVSGTVAQVQSAFSTPISKYRLSSGKTGYDNTTAPEVDAAVAPQIEGILGLDTLSPPQPSTSVPQANPATDHPDADVATPAPAADQPAPTGTSCTSNINSVEEGGALDAPELAQAYGLDSLYSSGDYGAGSTIALVEMSQAGYSPSDINNFATCYGLDPTQIDNQIKQVTVGGGGATGAGTAEAELDIETALSLAPEADIEVYEGGTSVSLYDVFSQIVNDDTAKIVSASWTNGCEAYVGQSLQDSENTLFEAAAAEGQSVFVAAGDQGAQGCNVNEEIDAATGSDPAAQAASDPVAQAVDPSTGTLYIADKSSNAVSVDSEGSTSSPASFDTAGSVPTGSGPDAVALDAADAEVFVANSDSTLTEVSTASCNQSTTSGCRAPTSIPSGGHLSSPAALAVGGSTLYVGNSNGTVAVYQLTSTTPTWVATVTLPSSSAPTALAVDTTNGYVYVADGTNNRIEYFSATTCNATTTSGCSATPTTVSVGKDPIALVVASNAGDLYVANAGTGGGISVISLSSHSLVTTIATNSTNQAVHIDGNGVVQSIGLSPDGKEILAVLNRLTFPGDVMATIDTGTQAITSTVNLETGTDSMGQLVSDGTLDYVWVTDETNGGDVIQNLNLAVSDPASQPYVTSVGGTSLGHGSPNLGPPWTEQAWNDGTYYAEGAGGGGLSATFAMPAYQQTLGIVSGSCAIADGCREVPDVSADADPSSGYIVYDSVNETVSEPSPWIALGGTSGATPLWAAVLAVVASANGNTSGYGLLNPALYQLAQQSPNTYLNDVMSGNNDYNATASGQYPSMPGYDMATGLGTPVASELADGLTTPLDVAVSGSQTYGGSPTFSASPNFDGAGTLPSGLTLDTSALSCTTVGTSTPISPLLPVGGYTLTYSCTGLSLSGADAGGYSLVYTTDPDDFTVDPIPVDVAVSGTQTYGGAPSFTGTPDSPPSGITVDTSGLTCAEDGVAAIAPTTPAGSYTLVPASCRGATLSGSNDTDYGVSYTTSAGNFNVAPAPLTVLASNASMTHGDPPPTITASYAGFVNGDSASSLSTRPTCSTIATESSPVSGSPYVSYCSGASDPNYTISYLEGLVTVNPAPPIPAPPPAYGYWLVGSDGGIFTFGSAQFYGSTGSIKLQRPVVGISPTANKAGYWLVASDGGIFAFGNAGYYGSIPGVGLSPAGSGQPHSLNAPIVAMVPSSDGGGYFMVASDGGVFAFGDARFAGSCPGIGGCSGTAVAVVPDASGNGYWLITQAGNVYAFGDAPFYGAPGNQGSPVTSAVRTANGGGYWILLADGAVYAYGDAASQGGPVGSVGGIDPASAIFSDAEGGGYWVASADGAVFAYGDAPNDGSMAGNHLNGSIIAATGF